MARIRSIKPEFWSSEQVMECSLTARLLFIGLWNFCDDGGNHALSAKTIKAEVFPGDDISSESVRLLLDELSSKGLIIYYTAENKEFLHVTGWHHQKIEKPSFKHPAYIPQKTQGSRRIVVDDQPAERSGVDRSGEEGNGAEPSPAEPPPAAFIRLPLNDGSEYPITEAQVREFTGLYPAVDVKQQFRAMRAWCVSNPTKRKTRSGVLRYVNAWLSKEQNSGRAPTTQNPGNESPAAMRKL